MYIVSLCEVLECVEKTLSSVVDDYIYSVLFIFYALIVITDDIPYSLGPYIVETFGYHS